MLPGVPSSATCCLCRQGRGCHDTGRELPLRCRGAFETPRSDQSLCTVVHTARPHCQLFKLWGVVVICCRGAFAGRGHRRHWPRASEAVFPGGVVAFTGPGRATQARGFADAVVFPSRRAKIVMQSMAGVRPAPPLKKPPMAISHSRTVVHTARLHCQLVKLWGGYNIHTVTPPSPRPAHCVLSRLPRPAPPAPPPRALRPRRTRTSRAAPSRRRPWPITIIILQGGGRGYGLKHGLG